MVLRWDAEIVTGGKKRQNTKKEDPERSQWQHQAGSPHVVLYLLSLMFNISFFMDISFSLVVDGVNNYRCCDSRKNVISQSIACFV